MTYERACGFCGDLWRGGSGYQRGDIDLRFCGHLCLKAWEAKVAFSQIEIEAIEKMLPAMGEYVTSAGIVSKPFAECSRDEILGLFATTVKTFRDTFQDVLGDDLPF